jgi:hypothetical protein
MKKKRLNPFSLTFLDIVSLSEIALKKLNIYLPYSQLRGPSHKKIRHWIKVVQLEMPVFEGIHLFINFSSSEFNSNKNSPSGL